VIARRGNRPLLPLIFAAVLACQSVPDAIAASAAPSPRPRIGLALSGGGARGAAHIGVLRVLEEHRIPIDCVAGTSMGAVVGGLYASGLSPAELDSVISEIDWMEAFADRIPRRDRSFRRKRDDDLYLVKNKPGLRDGRLRFPPGILDGQRIDLLLKRLSLPVVTVRDFDDLSIPYRGVAADIVTGEAVVLDHGDLALAMRTSMSIPAVFAPREVDGRLLVDGGITDNFPIDLVRRLGADVVIAVDIATPPQKREDLESVLQIALQLATLASDRNKERQVASLGPGDVLIRPELGKITVASFDRAAEAIPIGRRAAEAALPALERLAVSAEEYRAHEAARTARAAAGDTPTLGAVRLVNRSRLGDEVIAARLEAPIGAPVDVARLEEGLERIYGLELFESVYYDIAPGPRGNELTVTARERAWGPNYIQGGIAVFEDFGGPNFNVALAYSRTAINRLNGEWRTGIQVGQEPGAWTELYQPLDHGLRTFVDVELSAIERALSEFDEGGHKRSEIGITQYGGVLAAGREFGTWGEVRAGIVREGGKIRVQVGDPGAPSSKFDTGEAFAQLFVDRLDEVAFPHHGGSLRVRGSAGLDALGSTVEYEQAIVEGSLAVTRGRYTGLLGGMFATTRDSDAPLESRFRLGGLGQLSGIEQDELVSQHAALIRALLYRPVVSFLPLAVNAGLSAEYGNVFQSRSEIGPERGLVAGSAFLGVDTPLGPLCIAYGRAERDRGNFYLTLGQPLGGRRPGFRSR
jgi:NTE family protein